MTETGSSGNFRAKINGTQWTAKTASASRTQGRISIAGIGGDRKIMGFVLIDSGAKRYILSNVSNHIGYYQDSVLSNPAGYATNAGAYPTEAGGEVVITSIDTARKRISGTFSFKAYRSFDPKQVTITEGVFTDISYSTGGTMNSSDTFRVKKDGVSWSVKTLSATTNPPFPPIPELITIETENPQNQTLHILFPKAIAPGTYNISYLTDYHAQFIPDPNNMDFLQLAETGTLTILSKNPATRRIRGTFSFETRQLTNQSVKTNFTEGYFSMTYY
ncbi:MAG: DUF6252 family protein [Chitinophagaceae bacterium]|nr:DUF6252 family protein [Chitinophagaceae bacterium]